MTDQSSAAAVARPESCKANLDTEYPTCERCGIAFHREKPLPCNPMTPTRLRLALLREAADLEGSHQAVLRMKQAGMPADPIDALARATALRAALKFIDRCLDSPAIMGELRRLAAIAARDAEDEKAD